MSGSLFYLILRFIHDSLIRVVVSPTLILIRERSTFLSLMAEASLPFLRLTIHKCSLHIMYCIERFCGFPPCRNLDFKVNRCISCI